MYVTQLTNQNSNQKHATGDNGGKMCIFTKRGKTYHPAMPRAVKQTNGDKSRAGKHIQLIPSVGNEILNYD